MTSAPCLFESKSGLTTSLDRQFIRQVWVKSGEKKTLLVYETFYKPIFSSCRENFFCAPVCLFIYFDKFSFSKICPRPFLIFNSRKEGGNARFVWKSSFYLQHNMLVSGCSRITIVLTRLDSTESCCGRAVG